MEIIEIEELKKELEKLKDLKIYVFEGEVYVKVEDYREKTIENRKLNKRIKELEQCNLNLQTWLDNKEKVNKNLREDLRVLSGPQYTHESVEKDMWKGKAKTYAFWLIVWIVFTVVLTFISILKIV